MAGPQGGGDGKTMGKVLRDQRVPEDTVLLGPTLGDTGPEALLSQAEEHNRCGLWLPAFPGPVGCTVRDRCWLVPPSQMLLAQC